MGTSAGTIVCAGVAGAIAIAAKRTGDLTARYGDEEFAVSGGDNEAKVLAL